MVEATKRKVQFMHVHHAFMYSIRKHEYGVSFICIYRLCLRLKNVVLIPIVLLILGL